MLLVSYLKLEQELWTEEIGPTINDPAAENYHLVQTPDAISLVMCSTLPYSGWLAKQVSKLPFMAPLICFNYQMMTDDPTLACAQVAETDFKVTDDQGWTYDLSAQWEMRKVAPDWMFQTDNNDWTWEDSGVCVPASAPYQARHYAIEGELDFVNKRSRIPLVEVNGVRYDLPDPKWIEARQEGWAPMEVVTQLQQCVGAHGGGYTLRFNDVSYIFDYQA